MSKIDTFLADLDNAGLADAAKSALQLLPKDEAVEACVNWAEHAEMLDELIVEAEEARESEGEDETEEEGGEGTEEE